MNKLREIIKKLSIEELELLKKDVLSGNMERLINKQIQTLKQEKDMSICPVCHGGVEQDNDKTLIFGSKGLRKKAVFCGNDCLEYFLHRLKAQEQALWRNNNGISRNNKDI